MLLPLFRWMEALPLGEILLQRAQWFGPAVNILHLLALTLFFGAVLVVDLRMLGAGLTHEPVDVVARGARPWLIAGLVGLLLTGLPQVMITPMREYYSDLFWVKMRMLVLATLFTFTIRDRVTRANPARVGPVWGKVVALVSIALWAGVAIPGRLIGLVG
jgi:hypothetical protein